MANSPSITAQKGRSFLLKISDGTSPNTYNTVTGMNANELSFNGNPADISNKGSAGWRELLADGGLRQMDFTGSGLVDTGSIYFKALQAAALTQTALECKLVSASGESWSGLFIPANFRRGGQVQGAETFDVTLNSSGPVVYSATGG